MTALEFGPPDLPWSQNGYLLFNAVRTENLLPRLYQWNPGIDCYPLFLGTRFKALLDVSPVIVAIQGPHDPVLQAFLENVEKIWGLLLFSHADLKTLFEHLRWLVSVDEPVGKATLLNLSDPPVANALFDLYPLQTDNRLFGPIEHVYAIDRFEQRWRHHQRLGDAAINNHQVLYRLSEAQIEALDESGFRNIVVNIDRHMQEHFPEYLAHLDSRQRFARFLEMAEGAYQRGFHSESDLLHFANVARFLEGQRPGVHPDIINLLERTSSLTPSQRVQQAHLRVLQRIRDQQGAQP
ncbi:Uncharacterised protein [Paucimonas lemoignei]|nr:Uncharacterised protein [Paucimonas lemoignei]